MTLTNTRCGFTCVLAGNMAGCQWSRRDMTLLSYCGFFFFLSFCAAQVLFAFQRMGLLCCKQGAAIMLGCSIIEVACVVFLWNCVVFRTALSFTHRKWFLPLFCKAQNVPLLQVSWYLFHSFLCDHANICIKGELCLGSKRKSSNRNW